MNWVSIPQMFSNLIAQVLPGLCLLLLFFATILGPKGATDVLLSPDMQGRVSSLVPIVTMLVVSQAIGMIVGQLWASLFRSAIDKMEARMNVHILTERLAEHNRMLTALRLPRLSVSANDLPETFVMHDHLHLAAPQEAARLVKLRAEGRYCHVLAIGAATLAICHIYFCIQTPSLERIAWEATLAFTAIVSFLRSHRLVRFRANGIIVTWLSLASGGQLPFQAPARPTSPDAPDKRKDAGAKQSLGGEA